jgi:ribosomal protein S18 acetylase RimI-like enzyme
VKIHRIADALLHQAARRGGLQLLRVFSRPLRPAERGAPPAGLELRLLGEDELVAHSRDPSLELREAMIRAQYRRGGVCLGVLDGALLAGYVWFAYDVAPHGEGIAVEVPPRAVYRYKALVRPAYRGRGIAPALYRAADFHVAREGRETVVSCIAPQNRASVAATLKSGSRPLGLLGYWRAGRLFAAYHSPAVRRLGLRFHRT